MCDSRLRELRDASAKALIRSNLAELEDHLHRLAAARCTALLITQVRLGAAALAAVGDVDRRELYALDATGSTRTWLRTQLAGDSGQLAQARRLHADEQVFQAHPMGELSGWGACQVCSALNRLPDQVAQDRLLHALWGPWCAIAGCTRTITVPHHVRPWWLSHQTTLDDLLPLCAHDHHDLHEGHRTLRLVDDDASTSTAGSTTHLTTARPQPIPGDTRQPAHHGGSPRAPDPDTAPPPEPRRAGGGDCD